MIAPHTLVTFAALAFVVIVIPGPSVLFIVGRALQHGRGPALVTVVGNTGGVVVHAALVAAGVGALVAASEAAFVVLKVAGGLYLVWLGIQAIRHRGDGLDVRRDDAPTPTARRLLAEAFTVGVTNPKTLVFVAAVLPQFVDPSRAPAWAQILGLGLVSAAIALGSDGAYALRAAGARDWWGRSPRRLVAMRATGGALMSALGVLLIASRRVA